MSLSCSKCGRQANGEHFVSFDLCRPCDDAANRQHDEEVKIMAAARQAEDERKAAAKKVAEEMAQHARDLIKDELRNIIREESARLRNPTQVQP